MNFLTSETGLTPDQIEKITELFETLGMEAFGDALRQFFTQPWVIAILGVISIIIAAIPIITPYLYKGLGGRFKNLEKEVKNNVTNVDKGFNKSVALISEKIDKVSEIPDRVIGIIEPVVDLTKTVSELVYLLIEGSRASEEIKEKAKVIKLGMDNKLEDAYSSVARLNEDTQNALAVLNKEVSELKKQKEKIAVETKKPKNQKKSSW